MTSANGIAFRGWCSSILRVSSSAFLGLLVLFAGCSNPIALTDTSEEGFFPSGDLRMHYVLDFPDDSNAPHSAVVLGHGSGPKTIRDLDGLASRVLDLGLAVLRYDKRGTGKSEGRFVPSSTSEVNVAIPDYYAEDMAAAVRFLRANPKIDARRVGLMGESQAGWVIPPAAVRADSIAFVILLSGPVMPLRDVGAYETLANQKRDLPSDSVLAILKRGGLLRGDGFDPAPFLEQLQMPGLWIYGAWDRNVPASASIRLLETMHSELNKPFTTVLYPNGDHGLRDRDSGKGIAWWQDVGTWLDEIGF